jgi:hypothetical protein
MNNHLQKLLSVASSQIAVATVDFRFDENGASPRLLELQKMLAQKNGFYAFESALHVLPSIAGASNQLSIEDWNAPALWRDQYESLLKGVTFFAEDILGVQFAIQGDSIVTFDPDTAEVSWFASSLENWAENILKNFNELTGYALAHEWQKSHGALQAGKRLLPKTPFVLGGEFNIVNLMEVDAVEGMRYRADLWKQLRELPDGAKVRLKVLPNNKR